MSEPETFGQHMLRQILPEDVYRPGDVLDKKGIKRVMTEIGRRYPDRYQDISYQLTRLGLKSGEAMGGASFSIEDLRTPDEIRQYQHGVNMKVKQLLDTMPRGPERKAAIAKVLEDAAIEVPDKVVQIGDKRNNRFNLQLKGAGRGNAKSVAGMLAGDMMASDSAGRPIPIPLTRGYSQGLRMSQYLADAYSNRVGVVTTKLGVAQGGFIGKLLAQSAHRAVVVGDDDDEPVGQHRGVFVDADDKDNVGALLARDYGPYKKNTIITPRILAALKDKVRDNRLFVRSPISSSSIDSGVYAKDVGLRENGRLAARGEHVGLPSAQAISEQVTQSLLCLSEGTLVRMADGSIKEIQDIQVGDWVLGADVAGHCKPVRVISTFDQGVKPCVSVLYSHQWSEQSDCQVELIATENHKILSTRVTSSQKSDKDNWKFSARPCGEVGNRVYAMIPQSISYLGRDTRKRPLYSVEFSHRSAVRKFLDQVGIPGEKGARAESLNSLWQEGRKTRFSTAGKSVQAYKRRSVTPVGELHCYDIEVDNPDHLFVLANGLIVSNSAKHGSGTRKRKGTPGLAGFPLIERLISPPKEGSGLAIHAHDDGKVNSIREAPQGGWYIQIGQGQERYAGPDFEPTVKVGDVVEAGDALTGGNIDPAEVTRFRGIGEGRLALTHAVRKGLKEAGFPVNRRNIELLSRGAIDRVEMEDEYNEFLPGDLVPYSRLEKLWKPRDGAVAGNASSSIGRYLESPIAHYTIGTKVTPRIARDFEDLGAKDIITHAEPPPFKPRVTRALDLLGSDPDYMTRFMGSNLQKTFMDSTHQSGESDEASTSFVPVRASAVDLSKSLFAT